MKAQQNAIRGKFAPSPYQNTAEYYCGAIELIYAEGNHFYAHRWVPVNVARHWPRELRFLSILQPHTPFSLAISKCLYAAGRGVVVIPLFSRCLMIRHCNKCVWYGNENLLATKSQTFSTDSFDTVKKWLFICDKVLSIETPTIAATISIAFIAFYNHLIFATGIGSFVLLFLVSPKSPNATNVRPRNINLLVVNNDGQKEK